MFKTKIIYIPGGWKPEPLWLEGSVMQVMKVMNNKKRDFINFMSCYLIAIYKFLEKIFTRYMKKQLTGILILISHYILIKYFPSEHSLKILIE